MAQRILALEFVGDRVRAAVAERSWNSFNLAGTYDKVRADGETDLSGALSRLIAETGQPDIVISALPADRVAKRLLELPFKDTRRLHQVVPFALEEHLPFPVDNGTVAFTRVGREADHTLVMAAMVRKTDMQHHLDLLQKAGLDPKTVTLAALALAAILGIAAIIGWVSYGAAADARAVVVWRNCTLRSIPTEADTSQKTAPLAAGTLGLVEKPFLGWVRLSFENGQTGWVRKEEVVGLWGD
jgi:type II secretory pathway component PulL